MQIDVVRRSVHRSFWLLAFAAAAACGPDDAESPNDAEPGGGNGGIGGVGGGAGGGAAGNSGSAANGGLDGGSGSGGEDAAHDAAGAGGDAGASGASGDSGSGDASDDSSLDGGSGAGGDSGAPDASEDSSLDGGAGTGGQDASGGTAGAGGDAGPDGAGGGGTCCAPGQLVLGAFCVTPCANGSPHYCPKENNSTAECVGGQCSMVCHSGWADCDQNPNNGCETALTNFSNCGACGNACIAGQKCSSAGCVSACLPSEKDCDDKCADTVGSPISCGDCYKKCDSPFQSVPACTAATCSWSCVAGYTACGNACVDTNNDVLNCGGCGQACPTPSGGSSLCVQGSCQTACPAGATLCGSTCCNGACNGNACSSTSGSVFATGVGAKALTSDATHLYFIAGSEIRRLSFSGGPAETLATGLVGAQSLVVDATHVYWTSTTAVSRVPLAGGSVEVVSAANNPLHIVEYAGDVYWTDNPAVLVSNVYKAPKSGGTATTLWNGVSIADIGVDADGVYIADYAPMGSYIVLPLTGGPYTLYPCPYTVCHQVEPDGSVVYAAGHTELSPLFQIWEVDKSSSSRRTVAASIYGENFGGLLTDATHLYFSSNYSAQGVQLKYAIRKLPKCESGRGVDVVTGPNPSSADPGMYSYTLGPDHMYFSLTSGDIWRAEK